MSSDKRIDDLLDDIKLARDKIYEVNGLIQKCGGKPTALILTRNAWQEKIKTDWEMIQKIINGKA